MVSKMDDARRSPAEIGAELTDEPQADYGNIAWLVVPIGN